MAILTNRQQLARECMIHTINAIEQYLHGFTIAQLQQYCLDIKVLEYLNEKSNMEWGFYVDWIENRASRFDLEEILVYSWWDPFTIMEHDGSYNLHKGT